MTRLSLSTRFSLLLSAIFLGGLLIGGFALWQALQRNAQTQITSKGVALLETMNSVRSYTSNNIAPLLADDLATQPEFIAETVPAFSAREVFERFREHEDHGTFFYKEATLNPTNPRDQADAFETALVEQMRSAPDLTEIAAFRELNNQRVFFIARPLSVNDTSCLHCHGDPAQAPANLLASYGTDGGFGWQLNEIVAAQIIYVPAEEVFSTALRSFWLLMGIFSGAFAAILLATNLLLRRYVIQPVGTLGTLAQRISSDEMDAADLETPHLQRAATRTDELGTLAQVFRRMASEIYERTRTLKQQVQRLSIEIDEIKRQRQVEEIVETDYFQNLQARVQTMRQRGRRQRAASSSPPDDTQAADAAASDPHDAAPDDTASSASLRPEAE